MMQHGECINQAMHPLEQDDRPFGLGHTHELVGRSMSDERCQCMLRYKVRENKASISSGVRCPYSSNMWMSQTFCLCKILRVRFSKIIFVVTSPKREFAPDKDLVMIFGEMDSVPAL